MSKFIALIDIDDNSVFVQIDNSIQYITIWDSIIKTGMKSIEIHYKNNTDYALHLVVKPEEAEHFIERLLSEDS